MKAGRDLTVASLQDHYDSKSSNWSAGADVTVGYGVMVSGNLGFGKGKATSDWVGQQTSVVGKKEVDIHTENHTHLEGAIIATEPGGKLKLDTGTFSYSDIKDKNKGSEWGVSVSGGVSFGGVGFDKGADGDFIKPYDFTTDANGKAGTGVTNTPYIPDAFSGHYSSHDQRGIVRATVTEGEIIVRNDPDADLSGLNRDIDRAREITKNEKAKMDVYVSKQAIEEILNKGEGIVENIESLAARFNAFLPSQDTPETSEGQGPAKQGDAQWAEESREYAQNLKVTGDNLKVLHDTIIEHGGTEADVKEAFTAMADAGAIAKEIDITVAEYGSHSAIPLEKAQLLLQKSVQSLKAMKDVFTRLNVDSIPPLYGEHSTALPPQQTTADVLWQSSVQSGRQAIGAAYETVRFMKGFSDKMGEGVWTATTSSLRYVQGSIHQTLSIESPAKQFADNVDSAIVRAVWEHPEKTFDISNNVQAAFWQADTAMRKAKGGYETGRAAWDLAMSMAAMFAPEFALRSPGAVGAAAGKAGSQAGKAVGSAAQTGKTVGNAVSGAGKAGGTAANAGKAGGAGTVWESIKATQPSYPGTNIPRSFEIKLPNGKEIWVHGNATEHLAEYAKFKGGLYLPEKVQLATQQQLSSLQHAVNSVTQHAVVYDKIINMNGWELKFSPPRQPGGLPALIHARYLH